MITEQQLEQLKKELNATISFCPKGDLYEYDCYLVWHGTKTKTFKLPKKYDIQWLSDKISQWLNSDYQNLRPIFERLGIKGNIYYTSFGFSYDMFFKSQKDLDDDTESIKKELDKLGIKYTNEFSDMRWVYRFRISQARENIDKIKDLK